METKLDNKLEDFNREILDSEIPVVLYFTNSGNAIFEIINRRIINISKKYKGEIKFIQFDVTLYPDQWQSLGIKELPAVLIL